MLMESLDTFIGLITVFLVLSLIVTALTEGLSNALNVKGTIFEKSINVLLGETEAARFFAHDAVDRLRQPKWWGDRRPAYVPDNVIADVILDLCVNRKENPATKTANPAPVGGAAAPAAKLPINPSTVDYAVAQLTPQNYEAAAAIKELWQQADFDVDAFKVQIAAWFNRTGDRSKGWFKRRIGALSFGIGFVAAIALNADTLSMFRTLSQDESLRASFVERASEMVKAAQTAEAACPAADQACKDRALQDACGALELGAENCDASTLLRSALPEVTPLLGFDLFQKKWGDAADGAAQFRLLLFALVGWLLTAGAVSLGAPFWFDLLQKVVQIRSSTKPAETAPAAAAGAGATGTPAVADVPRARALVRATAAAAPALESLAHFESARFGFSPMNFFWSARLAELAYVMEPELVKSQLGEWSAQGELLSVGDTQCVVACTPKAAFIAFRGTEQKLEDWMTDLKSQLELPKWDAAASYQVHQGFNEALDAIWRDLDKKLTALEVYERGLPIWLGGHSLGGALAAMAALRLAHHLKANNHRNTIACVHTVGQPRIGNPACAAALDQLLPARYFRSVNNRDVVPRVPLPSTPDLLGKIKAAKSPLKVYDYAHAGRVIYFTDTGKAMMDPPLWYRGLDTLAAGLSQAEIVAALKQTVGDHNVGGYVRLHRAMLDVTTSGAEG